MALRRLSTSTGLTVIFFFTASWSWTFSASSSSRIWPRMRLRLLGGQLLGDAVQRQIQRHALAQFEVGNGFVIDRGDDGIGIGGRLFRGGIDRRGAVVLGFLDRIAIGVAGRVGLVRAVGGGWRGCVGAAAGVIAPAGGLIRRRRGMAPWSGEPGWRRRPACACSAGSGATAGTGLNPSWASDAGIRQPVRQRPAKGWWQFASSI